MIFSETTEKFELEEKRRYAFDTNVERDLKKIFAFLRVEDLKNIGNNNMIRKLSGLKRVDLIEFLHKEFLREETLVRALLTLLGNEYKLFKRIIENNGVMDADNIEIDEFTQMWYLGIVYYFFDNNKFYLVVPDDIVTLYNKLDSKEIKKETIINDKAYKLLNAMLNLYGVVSYNLFTEYCSDYLKMDLFQAFDITHRFSLFEYRENNYYRTIVDDIDYFVNVLVDDEDRLMYIIYRHKEIEMKVLTFDELLKYSNGDYYDNTREINEYRKFLKSKKVTKKDIDFIILETLSLANIHIENPLQESLEFLDIFNIVDEDDYLDDLNSIVPYIIEVYNSTKLWTNNGWAPKELVKKTPFIPYNYNN